MPTADPVDALIEVLDDASRLLRDVRADVWAARLETERQRVAAGHAFGLRAISGFFGGMGSFNDLIIHPINGHRVELSDVEKVNSRLDVLRETIWGRTRDLIRELELG